MEISYDAGYNIAYIRLREKSREIETIKVSDELNVDISPDGKIYGLELMNANEQLGLILKKKCVFINEASQQRQEVVLI